MKKTNHKKNARLTFFGGIVLSIVGVAGFVAAYSGSAGVVIENVENFNYGGAVGGDLGAVNFITSATSLTDLDVTNDVRFQGLAEFQGALQASSTLQVTGATILTGATTLSSTLDVTATTTLEMLSTYQENATTTATVAMTYVASDSGKTIYIPATGSTHTLPPAATGKGFVFRFVVGVNFSTNMVITADPVDSIFGALDVDSGIIPCQATDVVTFVASAESPGDWVDFRSDGTNWFVRGVGEIAGALTCTG